MKHALGHRHPLPHGRMQQQHSSSDAQAGVPPKTKPMQPAQRPEARRAPGNPIASYAPRSHPTKDSAHHPLKCTTRTDQRAAAAMRLTCGHGRPGISRRRARNRPCHLPLPLFCSRASLSIPSLPPSLPPGRLLRSGLPALFSLAAQARPSRPHFLREIPWQIHSLTTPPHCILGPRPPGPTCQSNGTISPRVLHVRSATS